MFKKRGRRKGRFSKLRKAIKSYRKKGYRIKKYGSSRGGIRL